MFNDDSDRSWEILGRTNPYYAVLTDGAFDSPTLDAEAKRQFFNSGKSHVLDLLKRVEDRLGPVRRQRALDFGCGVGRLCLPMAVEAGFDHATGVDISPSMLALAIGHASEAGVTNADFVLSDDALSGVTERFSFVHSYIVLQHIPARRGERIVGNLIGLLEPNGVAALHLPFSRAVSPARELGRRLRRHVPLANNVVNWMRKRPWGEPLIQMNMYDLNSLMRIAHDCGVREVTVELLDFNGRFEAYLFMRRSGV